jgi:hypothetical protein
VTEIGDYAFEGCTGLTSICVSEGNKKYDSRDNCNAIIETETNKLLWGCATTVIPDSVTEIGDYAFRGCTGLTSIVIPNSVMEIGDKAFSGCTSLTSICVSEGNKYYDSRDNCNAIIETETNRLLWGCATSVIPDSVKEIEVYAFSGCTGLTSIVIPDSVTEIGGGAFSGCTGLTNIVIPDSVTEIEGQTFEGCIGLTSITIPDSVTEIEGWAFKGCTGLTNIVIPDSVTEIGNGAFRDCTGLTEVGIPNSVTEIGDSVFLGCINLKSIYCHVEDPNQINIERGVEYGGHQATLYVPAGKGVVAAYKKKAAWKKFAAIKPMEEK